MVAVPFVGAVFLAMLAIVIMICWFYLNKAIENVLRLIPIVGSPFSKWVTYYLEDAFQIVLGWVDGLIFPATAMVFQPIIAIENAFVAARNALSSTEAAVWQIVHVTIVSVYNANLNLSYVLYNQLDGVVVTLVNRAEQAAVTLFNKAEFDALTYYNATVNLAYTLYNQLDGIVVTLIDQAEAQTVALYNKAIAYADTAYADAINYTAAQFAKILTFTEQVAAQAAADTAHALSVAEQYADTTALHTSQILITDVQSTVATAIDAVWPDIVTGIDDVTGILGNDLPDILQGIKAIPRALPIDLATSIAGTAAIAIPMLKYLEQCGIPNCRNLSALGRDLQALLTMAGDASFLAFFLTLIHDPAGAKDAVDEAFGSLLDTTMSAARDLIGV